MGRCDDLQESQRQMSNDSCNALDQQPSCLNNGKKIGDIVSLTFVFDGAFRDIGKLAMLG